MVLLGIPSDGLYVTLTLKIKELTHNKWGSSFILQESIVNIDVQVYAINDQMMSVANCPFPQTQT